MIFIFAASYQYMRKLILFVLFMTYSLTFSQSKTSSVGFIENKGQIIDQKGKKNKEAERNINKDEITEVKVGVSFK